MVYLPGVTESQRVAVDVPPGLTALDGSSLNSYTLRLANVTQLAYAEQRNFDLCVEDEHGRRCDPPAFSGTYSAGLPAQGAVGWIDGVFYERVIFPGQDGQAERELDLMADDLAGRLFEMLGRLIPPNGRFWLAYEMFAHEGEVHRLTQDGLKLGVPLMLTPIGCLLFRADCWLGLRDWYIPEGWREGHRKLQGNKALNEDHARRRAAEAVAEIFSYLNGPKRRHTPADRFAVKWAGEVLSTLLRWVEDESDRVSHIAYRVSSEPDDQR